MCRVLVVGIVYFAKYTKDCCKKKMGYVAQRGKVEDPRQYIDGWISLYRSAAIKCYQYQRPAAQIRY